MTSTIKKGVLNDQGVNTSLLGACTTNTTTILLVVLMLEKNPGLLHDVFWKTKT